MDEGGMLSKYAADATTELRDPERRPGGGAGNGGAQGAMGRRKKKTNPGKGAFQGRAKGVGSAA